MSEPEVWYTDNHRTWRSCSCSDWDGEGDLPVSPGTEHSREKVPKAQHIEICYWPDPATRTVHVLRIRTMPEE